MSTPTKTLLSESWSKSSCSVSCIVRSRQLGFQGGAPCNVAKTALRAKCMAPRLQSQWKVQIAALDSKLNIFRAMQIQASGTDHNLKRWKYLCRAQTSMSLCDATEGFLRLTLQSNSLKAIEASMQTLCEA